MILAVNPADLKRGAYRDAGAIKLRPFGDVLFAFVRLSDNRRLYFVVLLLFVAFFFVIIVIVWVSRWHRIVDKLQPDETVFRAELDHAGIIRADPRRFRAV